MSDELPDECHLLVLPDGRLLARNVTPELSALLLALQPENVDLGQRAEQQEQPGGESSLFQNP